jgi:RND family efflux transporter MFP subunit
MRLSRAAPLPRHAPALALYLVGGLALAPGAGLAADPTSDPLALPPRPAPTEAIDGERSARGVLEPDAHAVLSARAPGWIVEIPVKEGASFKEGDPLVRFDCATNEALLAKAEAKVRGAQAQLNNSRALARLQSVGDLEVRLATAAAAEAEAEVTAAKVAVGQCVIAAPYDGRVARRIAQPAESVEMSEDLMEIVAAAPPRIRLLVPSPWLRWLRPDASFAFAVDETGVQVAARVSAIGAQVDPLSQSIAVLATLDTPGADLLPGMSGTAHFPAPGSP